MLWNLQYLRFIAATLVVMTHALQLPPRYGRDTLPALEIGALGVDIFFAISGFIMCHITEVRERSAGSFIYHRIARVAPPYWVITITIALLLLIVPNVFHNSSLKVDHFVASLLFIAWPHPVASDEALPLYQPGWTVNYEFLFYFVFAGALLLNREWRILLTSCVLLTLVLIGTVVPPEHQILKFYTRPILIEFIFGMLIGYAVRLSAIPTPRVSAVMFIFGVAGCCLAAAFWPPLRLSPERFLVWGVPSALMVAGGVFLELSGRVQRIRFLRLLGDASYATYLTHFFVLAAVGQTWEALHLKIVAPDIILVLAAIALSLAVGIAFHITVERPLVKFLAHLPHRKRGAAGQLVN